MPLERLRLWDVAAGRMTMPPGPVEIGAGASSADIRQTATLPVPAGIPARRPALVAAADFDDYANIALVDTTREAGTAVTPADPARPAWLTFTAFIRNGWAWLSSAQPAPPRGRADRGLARTSAGEGGQGQPARHRPGALHGGRYAWTEVSRSRPPPPGTGEVCLVLHGPVRLDWFRL